MTLSMENCNLCPRKCGVNRNLQKGFCKAGKKIKIARAALHLWEEPVISGNKGSGTVFFQQLQPYVRVLSKQTNKH